MSQYHLEDITNEVRLAGSPEKSAFVLLNGVADQIQLIKDDPAALDSFARELHGNTMLSQAFANNRSPQSM